MTRIREQIRKEWLNINVIVIRRTKASNLWKLWGTGQGALEAKAFEGEECLENESLELYLV